MPACRMVACLVAGVLLASGASGILAADPNVIDVSISSAAAQRAEAGARMPVLLALEGPTAFDLYAASGSAGDSVAEALSREAAFEALARAQEPARRYVLSTGATIVSTYDAAMNGFLVLADHEQVLQLSRTPGIQRIYRAPTFYPLLDHAVPLVGGETVMRELGLTGKDVTIAVIDTGIDYTHLSLGGSGRSREFQENNPRTVEPRSFPTEKVIGGYDFAGTYYTGANAPTEDADPLDENGHGTHVAGIAAGLTGNDQVFHGMAPDAKLIALKVFGARGGTNLATDAVEWAIEANMGRRVKGACQMPDGANCRVDIINMSLGASYATSVLEQQGVMRRAVESGIVVVAAAGNDEDVPFVTGAPAASDVVVSVANTFPSGQKADIVQVTIGGTTEDIEALEADGSLAKQMAEIDELVADLASYGRGCGGDEPTSDTRGRIALIARGGCSFREKLVSAAARGAVGALIYNNESGLIAMGAEPPGPVGIPAYAIGQTDGERLRAWLEGGGAATSRLARELNEQLDRSSLTDVISPSSSRGPSRTGAFKPNISAPGTQIVAPYIGHGDAGIALTGTSMASPMVAGAAALLVEHWRETGLAPAGAPLNDRSRLTAHDVGAMLMNYAQATVWKRDNRVDEPVPLARQGAGRLDILAAIRGQTLVRAGSIAEIGLGAPAVTDAELLEAAVSVRNLAERSKAYRLSAEFPTSEEADRGVAYRPSVDTLTLGPGESANVSLLAQVTGAGLAPYAGHGGQSCMAVDVVSEAEVDGLLVVTEVDGQDRPVAGGDVARVPIYLRPRPASAMALAPDPIRISPSRLQAEVQVANTGAGPGRCELYPAFAEDPAEPDVDDRIDLDWVGARRVKDSQGQDVIELIVHTVGIEAVPLDSEVYVFVDTNDDGELDDAIYGQVVRVGQQDVVYSALSPVTRQDPISLQRLVSLDYYAGVDLGSRTITLPVRAQRLGLAPGAPVRLKAIVLRRALFSDIVGARSNTDVDYAPDDGLVETGGQLSAGPGRLLLDESGRSYSLSESGYDVGAGQSVRWEISRRATIPVGGDRLLASYPYNPPGPGDIQIVQIVEGEPWTPTPEPPSATPTPSPTLTPAPTATPAPTEPGSVRSIYVPALAKDSALGRPLGPGD